MARSCSECGSAFAKKCHLDRHLLVHSGEKPFKCSQCGKAFAAKRYLERHLTVHTEERPVQCPRCDKAFKNKEGLLSHRKYCHNKGNTDVGKEKNDNAKAKTMTLPGPFNCTECAKAFKSKSYLARHLVVHSNERPFQCPRCGKTLARKCLTNTKNMCSAPSEQEGRGSRRISAQNTGGFTVSKIRE